MEKGRRGEDCRPAHTRQDISCNRYIYIYIRGCAHTPPFDPVRRGPRDLLRQVPELILLVPRHRPHGALDTLGRGTDDGFGNVAELVPLVARDGANDPIEGIERPPPPPPPDVVVVVVVVARRRRRPSPVVVVVARSPIRNNRRRDGAGWRARDSVVVWINVGISKGRINVAASIGGLGKIRIVMVISCSGGGRIWLHTAEASGAGAILP